MRTIIDIHVNNAKDMDVVMPMYNLIEYTGNYSKAKWFLWQYFRDVSPLNNAAIKESESLKSKVKTTKSAPDKDNTKDCWNSSAIKMFE